MQTDLLEGGLHIVFQCFVSHLSLNHDSIGQESQDFIITVADTFDFNFLLSQLKGPFDLVNAFLVPQESDLLRSNEKPFSPVAETNSDLIDLLDYRSCVVHDKSALISKDGDVRGQTEIVMSSKGVFAR